MWGKIISIFLASKKKVNINWFTERIANPVMVVFVYLLKNTGISPNQVTLMSLVIVAGAGAFSIFEPGHWALTLVAGMVQLSFVFKCANDMLLWDQGTSSNLGYLLNFLIDKIKMMLLSSCIMVQLW